MVPEFSLSKFIANSGAFSRRAAEKLIRAGSVTVSGKVVVSPEIKVASGSQVFVNGKALSGLTEPSEKIYLVLNKPEGFITTTSDDKNRQTVMDLLPKHLRGKIYPVGRLDLMSRGLLLFTNDGDLAYRLSHPKFMIKKTYFVTLSKNATSADLEKLRKGLFLHDGFIKVDSAKFAYRGGFRRIIVSLHSGRNRIVRRIFLQIGHFVETLERIEFAGLSLKSLPLGQSRLLSKEEILSLNQKSLKVEAIQAQSPSNSIKVMRSKPAAPQL